jgi:predicted dienelactone hydrolase
MTSHYTSIVRAVRCSWLVQCSRLSVRSAWAGLLMGCMGWAGLASGAIAAERIFVSYNLLERSIPVASLEAYVKSGTIDSALSVYAQYAKPEDLKQLSAILTARADLSPVAMAQFLYSPQGEVLLKRLGQVIQPESRLSGFSGLRAALILAAADEERGLTLLNVLRKFPTRGLRIDVERSLQIASTLERAVNQTQQAATAVVQQAELEAQDPIALPQGRFADLRQRGGFVVRKQAFNLLDRRRQAVLATTDAAQSQPAISLAGRTLQVDAYLPSPRLPRPITSYPVIVISHGLGSDRSTFIYLAEHLASYGFAVLVPEHPGSNKRQFNALINGTAQEVADPAEFINRPLDVTFVLDELQKNPALSQLNFQQVGVIGQSFGGYTALALAGAPLNNEQLQMDCKSQENTLNLSLLLQCRAADLKGGQTPLQDPRVKAVVAMNPVASSVLGQAGISKIQIPTMVVAGIADTVAPALVEQLAPFTWLTTRSKYLVTMDRGTHFSLLDDTRNADNPLDIPPEVVGPNPALAQRYVSALSVAFFQTYVANQTAFRPYLSAAYAKAITENPIQLNLVRSFTDAQLAQATSGRRVQPTPVPQSANPASQTMR